MGCAIAREGGVGEGVALRDSLAFFIAAMAAGVGASVKTIALARPVCNAAISFISKRYSFSTSLTPSDSHWSPKTTSLRAGLTISISWRYARVSRSVEVSASLSQEKPPPADGCEGCPVGIALRGRGVGVGVALRGRGVGVGVARRGRGVGVGVARRGRGVGVGVALRGRGVGVGEDHRPRIFKHAPSSASVPSRKPAGQMERVAPAPPRPQACCCPCEHQLAHLPTLGGAGKLLKCELEISNFPSHCPS